MVKVNGTSFSIQSLFPLLPSFDMCTLPGPFTLSPFVYFGASSLLCVCVFDLFPVLVDCPLLLGVDPVLSCPVLCSALLSACEWSSVRARPPCWPQCGSRRGSLRCSAELWRRSGGLVPAPCPAPSPTCR